MRTVFYKGGLLRQKGAGRFSGLLNVLSKGVSSLGKTLWSAGKQAIQKNVSTVLPQVGQHLMNAVSGKEPLNLKKMARSTLQPALKNTMADTLRNVVHQLGPIKRPVPKAKRSYSAQRPKRKRRRDIFDHGHYAS